MADYNPNYDLASVTAMVSELEPYLLSKELYWPLTARSPVPSLSLPRLTLGGLFLALARLRAVETTLSSSALGALRRAQVDLETVRSKWAAAIDRKIQQELKSRLDLWQGLLSDCREQPQRCADNFAQEVQIRVMTTLLFDQASPMAETRAPEDRLSQLDGAFRSMFAPGPFVWPEALQPSFPRDQFWYLYGRPKA